MTTPLPSGIVPAQLGFLAIYNPSLGTTDETLDDQIVYYASPSTLGSARRRRQRAARDGRPTDVISQEERNERLRQIGLAQGMVEFSKSFSGGRPVDSIDTEKCRVVLHELEPGWWILASIDLTRLPLPLSKTTPSSTSFPSHLPAPKPTHSPSASPSPSPHPQPSQKQEQYDYTPRDLKPPCLLLSDLLRAHTLFLLHHGSSLTSLFRSAPSRAEFVTLLSRFWDRFLPSWNVLLHGNPACAVWGGVKIAASGELGMGVGEEERGSAEREVLEGLVGTVEGLEEVLVGRFGREVVSTGPFGDGGKAGKKGKGTARWDEEQGWLGTGSEVGAEDGMVFLGVRALSRRSVRAVAAWMEDVYTWGENAYGVVDGQGVSRSRRKRAGGRKASVAQPSPAGDEMKGHKRGKAEAAEPAVTRETGQGGAATTGDNHADAAGVGGMDKMFSYLKLGYGTYWSLGMSSPAANPDADDEPTAKPANPDEEPGPQKTAKDPNLGYFLVGLVDDDESEHAGSPGKAAASAQPTLSVELDARPDFDTASDFTSSSPTNPNNPNSTTLRPVIYVHRPFIYILLFSPHVSFPPWPELSHTLQTQLQPLHKPLLLSTSYRPPKPNLNPSQASDIYDLIFDPHSLAVHSTIPNIPEPAFVTDSTPGVVSTTTASSTSPPPAVWTRAEALNTHNQIMGMFAGTRGDAAALERTCKTSRGWWVVWNRVPPDPRPVDNDRDQSQSATSGGDSETGEGRGSSTSNNSYNNDNTGIHKRAADGYGRGGAAAAGKEIFLVRRASDHAGGGGGGAVSGGVSVMRGASRSYVGGAGGWADGASRLAQGIGVDTRRYIEGLLSLNR
ncbi:hypothetical protein VTI74DRAFT_6358 [Chaetomium olivicolor]